MPTPTDDLPEKSVIDQAADYLNGIGGWFFDHETLNKITDFAEMFSGFEAGLLFLIGVIAQAAGGRILVAAVGFSFLANLLGHFEIWTGPSWVAPALTVAVIIGFLHLALSLLLGEQGAAQAFVMMAGALFILLLVQPLKFLRLPGTSFLSKAVRKEKRHDWN